MFIRVLLYNSILPASLLPQVKRVKGCRICFSALQIHNPSDPFALVQAQALALVQTFAIDLAHAFAFDLSIPIPIFSFHVLVPYPFCTQCSL